MPFEKGHKPYWTKGNPGGKGNRAKKGEPGRPAHVGYQRGHPPYYTGGSVPGHAPTRIGGNPALQELNAKGTNPYQFDQPLGALNRIKGGNRPKDKERECLEAIENGVEDKALKRFPQGMVARLRSLAEVAQDVTHKDWINAQRLVREIRTRLRGQTPEELAASREPDVIEVITGRLEVPLPGATRGEGSAGSEAGGQPAAITGVPDNGKKS